MPERLPDPRPQDVIHSAVHGNGPGPVSQQPPPQARWSAPLEPIEPHSAQVLHLLDEPQEWSAFSKPSPTQADCWESSVVVEGMHCAACALTLEETIGAVAGVQRVQVSAASHRARIVWSANTTRPSDWMLAIQSRGYRAVPANDVFASERRKAETRKALWRWMVAGFCMMQVMMYAYPAYTAKPGDLSMEMESLLRWASWVLSLPVMLFSCGPFFSNAWRDLRHGSISMDLPVALGIAITFGVSTAGTFEPGGAFGKEVYFDSLTMFVFFLLTGRWLELRLRDRTAGALEALMNRLPDSVERLLPDGSLERVSVRRLQVGDRVRTYAGEAFAADGQVEQGRTLVDESLLTGESHPLERGPGSTVVAGSHNLSSTVLVRVQAVGEQTRFAQIVALMESAATSKPHSARLADRLAKPFLLGVLLSAALACAWWWPRDPEHALMVAVAVLVVTCPCALSLATPAAMLAAAGTLARQGILVRNLQALESLAQIDHLVFDKTGTLTRDAMELTGITTRADVSEAEALQMAQALAKHSLHPVSRAIVGASVALAPAADVASRWGHAVEVSELPGKGLTGTLLCLNGQPDLPLRLGSARFCEVNAAPSDMLQVHLSDPQAWLASFGLQEALRADAPRAVRSLEGQGIEVHLMSGDATDAVARVAQQAGVRGVRAQCTPQEKLDALRGLQAASHRVAMVGDGLNDGPVLAGADVSFAFGKAVPLAQAKSDFVVLSDQLATIPFAVDLARRTMRVVRQNLWWALLYNAACVPLAVAGQLPAWLAGLGMATSSLLVVLNALRLAPVSGFSTMTAKEA